MSKTRNTGFLTNVVKYTDKGDISFVSGSTTLMSISSSGAVTVTGVISGSNALTSSYSQNSELLDNLDSTSFVFTSSFNTYSSSMSTRVSNTESTGSTLTSASASLNTASGSFSTRVTRIEGNYATTGSNVFLGAQTVCANITSTGTIIAQTLNVQQVTSSVVYSSGSNTFGCDLSNVQQFTGSVRITGSLSTIGVTNFNSCVSVNSNSNLGVLTISNGNLDIASLGLSGCSGLVLTGAGFTNNIIQIGFGYTNTPSNYTPATIGFKVDNGSGNTKGDLIFATRNSISDIAPTVRATIFNTGEACFGNTVCALTFNSTNLAVSNGSSNILLSSNNNEVLRIQGFCPSGMFTSFMSGSTVLGDVGNSNQAFSSGDATGFGVNARGSRVLQLGTNQAFRMTIAGTGETTFTCQVCAPSFISSGTICSTGNTCFGGMSIVNSCLGIGTASPITTLQINAVSPAIRLQETSSGGDKRLEFCVNTSGVAVIAANQSAQVLTIQTVGTERLRIDANGISCFACQICTTSAALSGNIVLNRANTSAGNNIEWRTASTLNWYIGTRGLVNNNFYIINEGLSGLSNVIINATTGVTTFACSVTANGSLTINEDGGGTKVLTVRSDWAGVDPAINVTTNNCLLLMTNNTVRLCLSNTGIATFACQVCSPQYITTQGSSVSYADGSNYLVWSSESEYSAVDNNTNCTLTTMKTWIADRTGCVRLKFAGYISSGPTYWGWRIYRNGTSAYTCQSYATCLETGCSASVHAYTTFSVGIGPVNPGDCITLQMVSTGGGSVPVPGQCQTLYAKEFRIYSTTPNFSAGSPSNIFGDRLGVGTCIPGDILHIERTAAGGAGIIVRNSCGASSLTSNCALLSLQLVGSGQTGQIGANLIAGKELDYSVTANRDAFFAIQVAQNDTLVERMRITSDGIISINGASCAWANPTLGRVIQIQRAALFNYNNTTTDLSYNIYFDGSNYRAIGTDGASLYRQIAGKHEFYVASSTSAGGCPSFITSMVMFTSGISCFGYTVCAPCFATISDYRMKSNLRSIEGLSIIMNTKPYKFDYNYDCSTSFGMIAHELQEVIPEAVFGEKDGEVMQGVDYMKLLPITIKAIQEQQCTICQLKSCLGIA